MNLPLLINNGIMKNSMDAKGAIYKLVDSSSNLNLSIEFEKVLDNLNLYAYKNWDDGEVIGGPDVTKYWIKLILMYPEKLMPDPDGALRLVNHDARVFFKKDIFIEPVKIRTQDDLSPPDANGKRKPKAIKKSIWLVTIEMPRHLIDKFESNIISVNGIDIDMSEVDSAYDDNNIDTNASEKKDLVGEDDG